MESHTMEKKNRRIRETKVKIRGGIDNNQKFYVKNFYHTFSVRSPKFK